MLGILIGMDQMDSYVARFWRTWCLWFRLQKTVDFPLHQGRQHFVRGAQADSHGPLD